MQNELKLWDVIPLSDFEIPRSPTNEAASDQSRQIWKWFKQTFFQATQQDVANQETDRFISESDGAASATIEIDWSESAKALEAHLNGWLENDDRDSPSARVVIGPPGSGISNAIQKLAERRNLNALSPPRPESIIEDIDVHKPLLASLEESYDPIQVIPRLERFYLRHEHGLTLIRTMIEKLVSGQRILIGCDSWAWAFLQRATGIENILGTPMTFASFDSQRLDGWLRLRCDLEETEILQVRDDKPVFASSPSDGAKDSENSSPKTSLLIRRLAARSRGNLGVAAALWNSSLRYDSESGQMSRRTIWVESPDNLELPKPMPDCSQDSRRFVLHTILLHGGLPFAILAKLLPFSHDTIRRQVIELQRTGVIGVQNGLLQVSQTCYPDVRNELNKEGFLVDDF